MSELMLQFAVARVTEVDCLLTVIEQNPIAPTKMGQSQFWFELYAFALLPVDVRLWLSDIERGDEVRRSLSRLAFSILSSFFSRKNSPHISEQEWNRLAHDRIAEYWSYLKEGDGNAFEVFGQVASLYLLGKPDMAVSLAAAMTFGDSYRVLPDLIGSYAIESAV
jgi:hypothetical protein